MAIIMDGNRRWAKERNLSSFEGHKEGAENVKKILRIALDKGLKYLTLWALSAENLKKRSFLEIQGLIKLIDNIPDYLKDFLENDLKFETIGNLAELPEKTQKNLAELKEKTKNNSKMTLTLGINYSGQDEIIRSIKKLFNSNFDVNNLTSENFKEFLDTSFLPNPDIIVRTGGEMRHSGFLLYDSAYSEYFFSDKYWPDFDEDEFYKVVKQFENTKRNFGK